MKKFLLSLAVMALGAGVASAASYTVFDITAPGTWTGDANGYTTTVAVDGKTFEIKSDKAGSSTDLISPVNNAYAWRVYKNSSFTIDSKDVDMKQIVITYDNYTDGKYCLDLVLSQGWTGSLSGDVYTLASSGLRSFVGAADNGQVRIKKIVVSDGTASAGMAEIEVAEAGETIYYNLQGMKVAEPENGLYIKVQGKKATKVLVRK